MAFNTKAKCVLLFTRWLSHEMAPNICSALAVSFQLIEADFMKKKNMEIKKML